MIIQLTSLEQPTAVMGKAEYKGPRLSVDDMKLVPVLGIGEEALVYKVGAAKHGPEGWREGMKWSICVIKLLRHLGKFLAGESRCPKDGQHHLASVKFWCNALMEYEQTHPEMDDVRTGGK